MGLFDYLGVAERYPFERNPATGGYFLVSGLGIIKQEIYDVLDNPEGSQIYLENKGSMLHRLKFEPNDTILKGLLIYFTAVALKKWVKKIDVLSVQVEQVNENQFNIRIRYSVKSTNEPDTFVYPFYKESTQ